VAETLPNPERERPCSLSQDSPIKRRPEHEGEGIVVYELYSLWTQRREQLRPIQGLTEGEECIRDLSGARVRHSCLVNAR
jgi:hypothetical protein